MPTRSRLVIGLLIVALTAAACGDESDDTAATRPSLVLPALSGGDVGADRDLPPLDAARAARGEPLYQQHCASCHGADGEGEADWMTPNADGSFKAPPHDASGHTWHHPDGLLIGIVDGSERFEGSVMPAFGDVLSPEEVVDVLEYIKSYWGEQEREVQWRASQRSSG